MKEKQKRWFEMLLAEKTPEEITQIMKDTMVLMSYFQCAIFEVETKFRVLNEQLSLERERNPIESIKTRLKSFDSIQDKMRRKGLSFSPETIEKEMSDIAGIRVICSFIDDIYMLADCLLKQDDIRLIEKKDYIKHPKPNGYRSLHLIVEVPIFLCNEKKHVKVEVQLRTIAMESWANLEHRLRYKKDLEESVLEKTSDLLLECADMSHTLDKKMQMARHMIEKSQDM